MVFYGVSRQVSRRVSQGFTARNAAFDAQRRRAYGEDRRGSRAMVARKRRPAFSQQSWSPTERDRVVYR